MPWKRPSCRYGPTDRRKAAPTVDLIAAVHIADKAYYERLNREFAGYDVVLYELIAPEEGAKLRRGPQNSHGVLSSVQSGVGGLLNLEFQLDHIDYTQREHGPCRHVARPVRQVHEGPGRELLCDVYAGGGLWHRPAGRWFPRRDRRGGCPRLVQQEPGVGAEAVDGRAIRRHGGDAIRLGRPKGSTIIAQRNKVALEGLRKQIAAGKKKIAIFYGAAHLPDMQKRLRNDFGLIPRSTRWLVAWDLNDSPAQ